ncbi:MAG: hypothetical protein IT184_02335 [Acidobacteria bacterium]|nr:hypothetical protein [Acidobacteriota bacterium]
MLSVSLIIGGSPLAVAAALAARPHQGQAPPDRSRDLGQAPFGWQWWNDPNVKSDLKLSDEKARVIEGIFQKRQAEAKAWWEQLQREQDRLTRMTRERVADEATYALQVSKVETLAARLREGRTLMLYRIYLELQPEQFKKLQDLMDRRRDGGRGRGADPGR